MHRQSVTTLVPGMVIAQTVYSDNEKVLLAEGTKLSPTYIRSLVERQIVVVHIRDTHDDRGTPSDRVMEQTQAETPAIIARLAKIAVWAMYERAEGGSGRLRQAQQARARAQARLAQPVPVEDHPLDALYQDVANIIDQVLTPRVVSVLESLKTHSPLTFQHSIDVTIISILIAKYLGLRRPQIRCLALGCLLHDIGKLRIERSILEKPDKLTPSEMERVKQHPMIGYTIMHGLSILSPLPATIALQHHERQDGKGYPAGLVGTNLIFRTKAQRLQPGRITLLAEIAAVADVYSALVSDRPHRPAFPLNQVIAMLRYLSGTHLNQELVETMLRLVPAFPVGHWVEVIDGAYEGWQGIVVRVPLEALMHPVIRLLIDAQGEPVAESVELDLQANPTTKVVLLPEDDVSAELQVAEMAT